MFKSIRFAFCMLTALLVIAACVTINVYFPEAAAEEAADRFIDRVIGPAPESTSPVGDNRGAFGGNWFDFVLPAAYAQANLDINTPAIQAIQARMKGRFDQELTDHFNTGAVGFTKDALVEIRDLAVIPLKDRNRVKAAVSDENRDREAVYREIAVANGHPEWEGQIRDTFAERWISRARAGWYYQDARGQWQQK